MTVSWPRVGGFVLLGVSAAWATRTLSDLAIVSPVHWPLLFPALVVTGIPAVAAAFAGIAYVLRHRRAPQLFLVLIVSLGQSWLFSTAAPDIEYHYRETVEQSRALWTGAHTDEANILRAGRGPRLEARSTVGF